MVWSSNPEAAHAVAEKLDLGTVLISQIADVGPATPFAGAKMSGIGVEYAEQGLHEFTQIQVINGAKLAMKPVELPTVAA